MIKYVVGFAFNSNLSSLALIEKQKPEWQKGLLNGIGGKIEKTDASEFDAMTREFKEEAGLEVNEWQRFLVMAGDGWQLFCFFTILGDEFYKLRSMEAEKIIVIQTDKLFKYNTISNLPWLIPMAIDQIKGNLDYTISNSILFQD